MKSCVGCDDQKDTGEGTIELSFVDVPMRLNNARNEPAVLPIGYLAEPSLQS